MSDACVVILHEFGEEKRKRRQRNLRHEQTRSNSTANNDKRDRLAANTHTKQLTSGFGFIMFLSRIDATATDEDDDEDIFFYKK